VNQPAAFCSAASWITLGISVCFVALVLEKSSSYPVPPESFAAANERTMNAEVDQALELIRQRSPKIVLGTITSIYERGIIDYLTRFAFDQSNPRKLWKTVRNATVDQLGIGATKEQFDNESDILFNSVVKHHFPELTTLQIRRLYRSFEHAIAKRIW
jgi:hypothetical protein